MVLCAVGDVCFGVVYECVDVDVEDGVLFGGAGDG